LSLAPTTILQLDGVSLRYDTAPSVLHGINLKLNAGSFHFLSGPTGAGKTSLLRLISLSLPPTSGSIRVFGREIDKINRDELASLRQRIGVVFQDLRLLEHLSAFDNVALTLRINGADEDETVKFVADMLGWLGLGDKLEALPSDLSMGQRQMVAIARAIVGKPRLLLADEPTSNIDAANARRLMSLFVQLHKLGATVVLATHSETLMDRYPYPVLRMTAGRLSVPVVGPPAGRARPEVEVEPDSSARGDDRPLPEGSLDPAHVHRARRG
jgi:cell division transport system ATP-binding protein